MPTLFHDVAVEEVVMTTLSYEQTLPEPAPWVMAPGRSCSHHRSNHTVIDGIEKVTRTRYRVPSYSVLQLTNAFILANLRDSGLAGLMLSTVSQHSSHFASSAFIPVPWKLSFACYVMCSNLHLQLTDKSTFCCAWQMAVKMKIRRGMLLCQDEGHFRSSSPLGSGRGRGDHFVSKSSCDALMFSLSLLGWMRRQVPGLFCSTAESSSCLTTLGGHTENPCFHLKWQQSPVFAERRWLYIYRAIIACLLVCVVPYMRVPFSQFDKYHKMTDLCCRAAVGVWHSKDQFQTVNKAWTRNTSQRNVTRPPFPHLFTLTLSHPPPLCPQLSHGHSANCSSSLSICRPCCLVPQYAAQGDRG